MLNCDFRSVPLSTRSSEQCTILAFREEKMVRNRASFRIFLLLHILWAIADNNSFYRWVGLFLHLRLIQCRQISRLIFSIGVCIHFVWCPLCEMLCSMRRASTHLRCEYDSQQLLIGDARQSFVCVLNKSRGWSGLCPHWNCQCRTITSADGDT